MGLKSSLCREAELSSGHLGAAELADFVLGGTGWVLQVTCLEEGPLAELGLQQSGVRVGERESRAPCRLVLRGDTLH